MADYQRSEVYRWEWEHIHPRDKSVVQIEQAQCVVNHIWNTAGLLYPPTVQSMSKNATRCLGRANRLLIQLREKVSTSVIIHEVAHSMTTTMDDHTAGHGKLFMGMYIKLLDKHNVMSLPQSMFLLNKHRIDFDINATPVFLD